MSPSPDGRTDPRFARALLQREDAFRREDEGEDTAFYAQPRMVSHLDTTSLNTVERLAAGLIVEDDPAVLDLMASVDSHLPRKSSRRTSMRRPRSKTAVRRRAHIPPEGFAGAS